MGPLRCEIGGLGRVNGLPTSGLILNVLGAVAQFEHENRMIGMSFTPG
jgi:hypothetical protein